MFPTPSGEVRASKKYKPLLLTHRYWPDSAVDHQPRTSLDAVRMFVPAEQNATRAVLQSTGAAQIDGVVAAYQKAYDTLHLSKLLASTGDANPSPLCSLPPTLYSKLLALANLFDEKITVMSVSDRFASVPLAVLVPDAWDARMAKEERGIRVAFNDAKGDQPFRVDAYMDRRRHDELAVCQAIVYEMFYEAAAAPNVIEFDKVRASVRNNDLLNARRVHSHRLPVPWQSTKALMPEVYRNVDWDVAQEAAQRTKHSLEALVQSRENAIASSWPPGSLCVARLPFLATVIGGRVIAAEREWRCVHILDVLARCAPVETTQINSPVGMLTWFDVSDLREIRKPGYLKQLLAAEALILPLPSPRVVA